MTCPSSGSGADLPLDHHPGTAVPLPCSNLDIASTSCAPPAMDSHTAAPVAARMGVNQSGVDPKLWYACAGSSVHLPQVSSHVIYFPQGHAEHSGATDLSFLLYTSPNLRSSIPCRVTHIDYLADLGTDEIFACISLVPESDTLSLPQQPPQPQPQLQTLNTTSSPEKHPSFAKTLTQSDANNGGGFSVPRYCAETILPKLDYSKNPPVQTVFVRDVHGEIWKFRHIYRGTPRRHLLTTGWSNFVNQKKLIAGDTIIFLKGPGSEIHIGIRRSKHIVNSNKSPAASVWPHQTTSSYFSFHGMNHPIPNCNANTYEFPTLGGGEAKAGGTDTQLRPRTSFTHNQPRIARAAVIEAARKAAEGKPFEVAYYPRSSIFHFCVDAQLVLRARHNHWTPGMRFKMSLETEDLSRSSWFTGTISKVGELDPFHWPSSIWKSLQVSWDDPELLQGISRVNPWQVELVSPIDIMPFTMSKKKIRETHPIPPYLQLDGSEFRFPSPFSTSTAVADNAMSRGQCNLWQPSSQNSSLPAVFGMEGARHDHLYKLQSPPNNGYFLDKPHPSSNTWNNNSSNHPHSRLNHTAQAGVSVELQMSTSPPLQTYSSGSGNNLSGLNSEESEPLVSLPVLNNPSSRRATVWLLRQRIGAMETTPEKEPNLEPSSHNLSDAGNYVTTTEEDQNEQNDLPYIWLPYDSEPLNETPKSNSVEKEIEFNLDNSNRTSEQRVSPGESSNRRENEEAGSWTQLALSLFRP